MKKFKTGAVAPDFTLPDDTGTPTSLSSFRGAPVVLYCIPKAGSPGCMEQAAALLKELPKWKKLGVRIVGVAPDSQKKLANFRKKAKISYTLLSDAAQKVAAQYGVWVEKKMYGHTFFGMERVTLILDSNGRIAHTIAGITPREQPLAVTAALNELKL